MPTFSPLEYQMSSMRQPCNFIALAVVLFCGLLQESFTEHDYYYQEDDDYDDYYSHKEDDRPEPNIVTPNPDLNQKDSWDDYEEQTDTIPEPNLNQTSSWDDQPKQTITTPEPNLNQTSSWDDQPKQTVSTPEPYFNHTGSWDDHQEKTVTTSKPNLNNPETTTNPIGPDNGRPEKTPVPSLKPSGTLGKKRVSSLIFL